MGKENINVENVSNVMNLFDDVNHLSEQVQSIKEDLDLLYPLDELKKNNQKIEDIERRFNTLTDRLNGLEQYKTNLEGLSSQNEILKLDIEKEKEEHIQKYYSLKIGYRSLVFLGAYSLLILIFAFIVFMENSDTKIVMTLIIGGLSALLIFAIVLMFFANKTKKHLIHKDK